MNMQEWEVKNFLHIKLQCLPSNSDIGYIIFSHEADDDSLSTLSKNCFAVHILHIPEANFNNASLLRESRERKIFPHYSL